MAKHNREEAISATLFEEGGYVNHPSDPGGATNFGITIADARKYWKKDATPADVKAMPKSVAIDIYRNKYWKTPYYDCDNLPAGVDLAVFDFGVNSGPSRAKRYLDAHTGRTPEETINKLCDARLAFVKGLRTWSTFGAGWSKRIGRIRTKALAMARRQPPIDAPIIAITGLTATIAAAFQAALPYVIAGGAVVLLAYIAYKIYKRKKNVS